MADYLVIDGPLAGQHVEFTGDHFLHRYYPEPRSVHRWWIPDSKILVYQKFKVATVGGPYYNGAFEFVYATSKEAVDEWCRELTKRMCRGL